MIKWLWIITGTLRSLLRNQRELALENLALRQQLAAFKHRHSRPRLSDVDRLFWVPLSSVWSAWRDCLHIVQPETVVRWHRQGFRYYWRWKSRGLGRPKIDPEIRVLVQRMCRANPLWGAPRIHGELDIRPKSCPLKAGILAPASGAVDEKYGCPPQVVGPHFTLIMEITEIHQLE